MRELKFSAIYKPTGETFIPNKIDLVNKTVWGDFDGVENDYCFFSLEPKGYGDAWLRQFTGLKDKNGKEIAVGDILDWDEKEWGGRFNELVEWNFDQLSSRVNDWPNHCEIIGNKWDIIQNWEKS